MMEDETGWLKTYFQSIDQERIAALNKMDKTSDWAIALVGIIIAAIVTSWEHIEYGQYLPLVGSFFLLIFALEECKNFRYFDKWMTLVSDIEQYFFGKTGKEELMAAIEKYDLTQIKHGTVFRVTKLWALHRRIHRFYTPLFIFLIIFGLSISFLITENISLSLLYLSLFISLIIFELYGNSKRYGFKRELD